jgi:hypothetical protein
MPTLTSARVRTCVCVCVRACVRLLVCVCDRFKCLAAVTKLAASMDVDALRGAVAGSPLLGYVAGYLASGVPGVVGLSLLLADLLLERLPALARVREPHCAT